MAKSKSRRCGCLCILALVCIVAVICICVALICKQKCDFASAAVSADSLMCSNIGRDVLYQGGSAVDAAIAALVCTGLVNPQSMGLGGGAIFTIMDKTGKVKIISSRETAPKGVRADLLKNCPNKMEHVIGSHWIGVPGELRGYEKAHQLYGKLPWNKLFEPSIKLAREGFPMPVYLTQFLNHPMIKPLVLKTDVCQLFCNESKTGVLGLKDVLKYPRLAETMEIIAKKGAEAFYTGEIAKDLIADIQARNGTLSLEDLQNFQVRVSDAWSVQLGDYNMYFPPPPAGGAILAFILKIMHGFGLSPASNQGDQKNVTLHRYLEAVKFANGQRRFLKDPQFSSTDMKYVTDEKFIEQIRALITDSAHDASYYNITRSAERFGTTHVSVLAADGSAVSVTSTINHMFGSAVYSPKTGIILNNELADFCGRAHSVTPGEQPPSSMAPAILQSPHRTLVIGGSGGSMITSAMALSIMNHLWFGMNLDESIAAKIVNVDSTNVSFENGYNNSTIQAMKNLGHVVKYNPFFLNVVNGISKEGHCLSAVSDSRKQGQSAGY